MEDEVEQADVILIPGGSHNQLIERAVDLYNDGLAAYILPSGGSNKNLTNYDSEWEFLYKRAIELGIPKEAILKEDKAKHTFDNAQLSLSTLNENKIVVNKAILVCKNFHARRAFLTYATVFPSKMKILVSPVIDNKNIKRDNWYLDESKICVVMNEVVKIGKYFENHILEQAKRS